MNFNKINNTTSAAAYNGAPNAQDASVSYAEVARQRTANVQNVPNEVLQLRNPLPLEVVKAPNRIHSALLQHDGPVSQKHYQLPEEGVDECVRTINPTSGVKVFSN